MNNSASRAAILARIRSALLHDPAQAAAKRQAALDFIAQHRQGPRPLLTGDLAERFCQRSAAMSSTVEQVTQISDVPTAIARYLAAGALPKQAVCWPEYGDLDWASVGLSVEARAARGNDLVGITGAFCAIAETGTLMLLSGPQTAATTSLLPETHIAIVHTSRIVAGMEEGFSLLRAEGGKCGELLNAKHGVLLNAKCGVSLNAKCGVLPRAVNFVSGPSRTGDIEQTIVLGAHGPYRVHLVIVEG